jgi:6,7-dimethyl-8-ribityllumazine synthase
MGSKQNLSDVLIPNQDWSHVTIAVIKASWNEEITHALREGCVNTLQKAGVGKILEFTVPGSFELAQFANLLLEKNKKVDAVVCLGCVIKGETPHFEYISSATAHGIMQVSIKHNVPVIFGVLTTLTLEQAKARAGGIHGNKGVEAAATALQMIHEQQRIHASI